MIDIKCILYYLKIGALIWLVTILTSLIIIVPSIVIAFSNIWFLYLLLLPLAWALNGYFINRWHDKIFK